MRAGIKPATDCMMMLTVSSVGCIRELSSRLGQMLAASKVSLRVVISCWAIHPTKNIFMANQSA